MASKKLSFKTPLEKEVKELKEIVMGISSGETDLKTLIMKPDFYATKLERLESLLWLYELEERVIKHASEEGAKNVET